MAVFDDLSKIAQTRPEIKVITFNSETIFTNAPIDVGFVKGFVAARNDMKYPIYIDTHRVAVNSASVREIVPVPGSFPAPRARPLAYALVPSGRARGQLSAQLLQSAQMTNLCPFFCLAITAIFQPAQNLSIPLGECIHAPRSRA